MATTQQLQRGIFPPWHGELRKVHSMIYNPWLIFIFGFTTGWLSLLFLVWIVTEVQRRRNRRAR